MFWITFFAMSAASIGAVNAIGSVVASDIGIALLTPVCVALFADAIMIGQVFGVYSYDHPESPERTTWSTEHSRLLVEAYIPSVALVAAFLLVKMLLEEEHGAAFFLAGLTVVLGVGNLYASEMWINPDGPTLPHVVMDQLHIPAYVGPEGPNAYDALVRSIYWHTAWDSTAMVASLVALAVGGFTAYGVAVILKSHRQAQAGPWRA